MNRLWLACFAVCGAGLLLYFALRPRGLPADTASDRTSEGTTDSAPDISPRVLPVSHPSAVQTVTISNSGPVQSGPPGVELSVKDESPNSAPAATAGDDSQLSPASTLEHVRRLIIQYHSMFGENPVGTNEEITRSLQGDNPKQINFLNAGWNHVNAKGELLDSWGTPYFFHQISAKEMEIRSAGPDKVMWTSDDLVTR
jgi:hypothetical protein